MTFIIKNDIPILTCPECHNEYEAVMDYVETGMYGGNALIPVNGRRCFKCQAEYRINESDYKAELRNVIQGA